MFNQLISFLNMIPYSRPKCSDLYTLLYCLKTIPFIVAHTYVAHIWQYPPPPPQGSASTCNPKVYLIPSAKINEKGILKMSKFQCKEIPRCLGLLKIKGTITVLAEGRSWIWRGVKDYYFYLTKQRIHPTNINLTQFARNRVQSYHCYC